MSLFFFPDLFLIHIDINLRCGDVGMSEHFLHALQVCAVCNQMCRKAVAQSMRRDLFRDSRALHIAF